MEERTQEMAAEKPEQEAWELEAARSIRDWEPSTESWQVRVPRGIIARSAAVGFDPQAHADSIAADTDRLIKSIITNKSCNYIMNLSAEELYGELQLKTVKILNREDMVFDTRGKFFGLLKMSLTNFLKSLIQRHRFTFKRTGEHCKPRVKGVVPEFDNVDVPAPEPEKPVYVGHISLDEADGSTQNLAREEESVRHEAEANEMVAHFLSLLNEDEAKVLRQEMEPNDAALDAATREQAEREAREQRAAKVFRMTDEVKAAGIGMSLVLYHKLLESARVKIATALEAERAEEAACR